jgi:hypothetical protein
MTHPDTAAAEAFIAECERLTNAAKELLRPRAVSPARAKMIRWVKPQPSDAKG